MTDPPTLVVCEGCQNDDHVSSLMCDDSVHSASTTSTVAYALLVRSMISPRDWRVPAAEGWIWRGRRIWLCGVCPV